MMKKIALLLFTISLLGLVVAPVKAEEMMGVDPAVYQSLKKKQEVVDFMKGKTLEGLTKEEQQLLVELLTVSENEELVGRIEEIGERKYKLSTGINGIALGRMPIGNYQVKVTPVKDVIETTRVSEFVVGSSLVNRLKIGLIEIENSKAAKEKGIDGWFKKIRDWYLMYVKPVLAASELRGEKVEEEKIDEREVELFIFSDLDENGVQDEGEEVVPWANFIVELEGVGEVREEVLVNGGSIVNFPKLPKNAKQVSQLLYQLSNQGCSKCFLSWKSEDSKGEQVSGVVEGAYYGLDGELVAGRDYKLITDREIKAFWVY